MKTTLLDIKTMDIDKALNDYIERYDISSANHSQLYAIGWCDISNTDIRIASYIRETKALHNTIKHLPTSYDNYDINISMANYGNGRKEFTCGVSQNDDVLVISKEYDISLTDLGKNTTQTTWSINKTDVATNDMILIGDGTQKEIKEILKSL